MKAKMSNAKYFFPLAIYFALVLLMAAFGYWYLRKGKTDQKAVSSFAECEKAGYPVMESYPRQCRDGDGQLFVEPTPIPTGSQKKVDYVEYKSLKGETVRIKAPKEGEAITSPLKVSGEVRGNWSFEASFPVRLEGPDGTVLASGNAALSGDWMTDQYVPFTASLGFSKPASGAKGTLVLKKDNPSGLPEKDDSVEIPVVFGN